MVSIEAGVSCSIEVEATLDEIVVCLVLRFSDCVVVGVAVALVLVVVVTSDDEAEGSGQGMT
jgi:hypothetical protein